nr:adenylate/guanylate cyclase domain-containing protein [Corynebacterium aquatimens]
MRDLRWLWSTPWPLYAAVLLFTNVVGAVAIMYYVRFLIPMPEASLLGDVAVGVSEVGIIYLFVAVVLGGLVSFALFRPVLYWQRNPQRYKRSTVRRLILRIPVLQTLVVGVVWLVGILIATAASGRESPRLAVVVGIASTMAGLMSMLLTYVQAERLMRPISSSVLGSDADEGGLEPPVRQRMYLTWVMTSALPLVGILLLLVAQYNGFFRNNPGELMPAISALAFTALITGFAGTAFTVMSVVDPIMDLQDAINRVRKGETDTQVDIYDGSELGVLQAGFNEMIRGLGERQRLHDIFGRYVGSEVAAKALEDKPELGGELREVGVVFVDVMGSTGLAVERSPKEVVEALNEFFEIVVSVVHRNSGVINKFEGDAALAVFNAPLSLEDYATRALACARELRQELRGLELDAGIGVAAGQVVAGHIGGEDRFEYTVIGDAVNTASRLTDLAKDTPGRVLTNTSTLERADKEEQERWTRMKSIELRGRFKMTQLARPVRPTMADKH